MCVLAKQGIMLDVILLGPASLNLAVLFKLFVHKTIWSMKDIKYKYRQNILPWRQNDINIL